jgi:hypothetical protein
MINRRPRDTMERGFVERIAHLLCRAAYFALASSVSIPSKMTFMMASNACEAERGRWDKTSIRSLRKFVKKFFKGCGSVGLLSNRTILN